MENKTLRIIAVGYFLFALSRATAQDTKGVHFESGLSWKQIQEKAKAENKFIFVDCYATWCGPCKEMDKTTYPDSSVGAAFGKRFICIKVQMDQSPRDEESVKVWYGDAKAIGTTYRVKVYPTFLFFSPDGTLVHERVGFQSPVALITLAEGALDPNKQYFTRLGKFRRGEADFASLPALSNDARAIGDTDTAAEIGRTFVRDTNSMDERQLMTKDMLMFAAQYMHSSDKVFGLYYAHGSDVDGILGVEGHSQAVVDYVIAHEELYPKVADAQGKPIAGIPDWDGIAAAIAEKYSAVEADRLVTSVKMRWYSAKGDWPEAVKNTVIYMEKYSTAVSQWDLNANAWNVFQHSDNKEYLNSALSWSKRAILIPNKLQNGPNTDTYANLLYRLGKIKEAIIMEEKALGFAEEIHFEPNIKDFSENLKKMKKREPTWVVN